MNPNHRRQDCRKKKRQADKLRQRQKNERSDGLWNIYRAVIARCECKSHFGYGWYGARGIKMWATWRRYFWWFVAWSKVHGYKRGLQLDRIDKNGDYAPWNCRWVTREVNGRENKDGVKLSRELVAQIRARIAAGETSVAEEAEAAGVSVSAVYRVKNEETWQDLDCEQIY